MKRWYWCTNRTPDGVRRTYTGLVPCEYEPLGIGAGCYACCNGVVCTIDQLGGYFECWRFNQKGQSVRTRHRIPDKWFAVEKIGLRLSTGELILGDRHLTALEKK